jgi:hypothetical protein
MSPLSIVSLLTLLLTIILFVITSTRRRQLDRALIRSVVPKRVPVVRIRQLGLFTAWPSKDRLALAQPERRWTYDQGYMVAFIEAMYRGQSSEGESRDWIRFYAGPVLHPDIMFAIAFAACIVATALLVAQLWPLPWLTRAAFLSAAMGVVYGSADIAEDLKLQRILRQARRILSAEERHDSNEAVALADAAEVDAANALTRLKVTCIVLSVIGICIFLVLRLFDSLTALFSSEPGDSKGPRGKA